MWQVDDALWARLEPLLTIDTPRGQVMQLLAVLGLGLGLAMMPIMAGPP